MEFSKNKLKIYFAGDLFTHKALIGNLLIAEAIERLSSRYEVILPQTSEANQERDIQSIRNSDLNMLFSCDCIVANFDGPELDSGTVVEFCFAKMLDLPTVLLRTDFRNGGDTTGGTPWNLMCSCYPRTQNLLLNSIVRFNHFYAGRGNAEKTIKTFSEEIATQVIDALDSAVAMPTWIEKGKVLENYRNAVSAAGGNLSGILTEERLKSIINEKIKKGLY